MLSSSVFDLLRRIRWEGGRGEEKRRVKGGRKGRRRGWVGVTA